MDGIWALPEHLQHEVFSRVGDIKALFRFAATCRGWLCRFADRAFLRELWRPGSQGEGSDHLLGVFVQDTWKWFSRRNKDIVQARKTPGSPAAAVAPIFLPALGSPLGPAARALTSFVGGDDDGAFDYAVPLAARRGIVLLRLRRTPDEEETQTPSCHLFGVCNPITGARHVLAPLKWCLARNVADNYAIITAADGHSDTDHPPAAFTFSQLMVITEHPRGEEVHFYLHSYSAATRCWSARAMCLDRRVFNLVGAWSAVVHRGAAHWLCVDAHHLYRLSVEVATARVSLTKLLVRVGKQQLLFVNSDGELAVASVYPMHVTIWTPPAGDGDGDDTPRLWPRTSFRIPPHHHHHEKWCTFSHGSLLALFTGGGAGAGVVFVVDLDTKVMQQVFSLDLDNKAMGLLAGSSKQDLTCVPYVMDLVEFFTLHLGGIRERLTGITTTSQTESP